MIKTYMLIICVIVALLSCDKIKNITCEPEKGASHLISDKNFTKQYSFQILYDFVKSHPKNQFTKAQVKWIYKNCRIQIISPIVVLFKAQFETGLLINNDGKYRYQWREDRIMCYGLHKSLVKNGRRVYPYKGFSNQIYYAVKQLRSDFDNYNPGNVKIFEDDKSSIKPDNAATHAIYEYTPFFKSHKIYNWSSKPIGFVAGNDVFIKYFDTYLSRINNLRGKK